MDSLSHVVFGAAIGVATLGRRSPVWKAALWGAVAGNLPDLDVLIDHGDPIRNMVLHRAETHAPFWLTLFSLPFAAAVARLHGEQAQWRRWWLALWLALVTHPLLDAFTVYGTRLALPFSDEPVGLGSIFIIDPLFTLPLLIGSAWVVATRGSTPGRRANILGLVLGGAYLAWGVAAQQHQARLARASLAAQGIAAEKLLVTPTAFNSLLWRVVALSDEHYHEGFHSLLDSEARIEFDAFARGTELAAGVRGNEGAQRIAAFSKGFYRLQQVGPQLVIRDLRMGQEPAYTFSFVVARSDGTTLSPTVPRQVGTRPELGRALPWLWRRMWGEPLPPPR